MDELFEHTLTHAVGPMNLGVDRTLDVVCLNDGTSGLPGPVFRLAQQISERSTVCQHFLLISGEARTLFNHTPDRATIERKQSLLFCDCANELRIEKIRVCASIDLFFEVCGHFE